MFLASKKSDDQQAKSRPVGQLPFVSAPKCGLFQLQTSHDVASDGESSQVPASIAALQRRVAAADSPDHFDVLSVSAASPVPCGDCSLTIQLSSKTIAYAVHTTYDLTVIKEAVTGGDATTPEFVFLFPFSECGAGAESFQVVVGGQPLFGEIVRVRRRDGRLVSSTHQKCFLAETSDMSDDNEEVNTTSHDNNNNNTQRLRQKSRSDLKLLYLYVVERSMLQFVMADLLKPGGQTSLKVEVHWRCKITPAIDSQRTEPLHVPFSYYCAPRSPDRIACHAQFAEGTRILVVKSPNCRGALSLRAHVHENVADVQVECIGDDGRRNARGLAAHRDPRDYLWLFQFYFGAVPKTREEISLWGLTCVLIVAALVVWYLLTKDLEL